MKPKPCWLNKTQMAASCGVSVQAFSAWGVEPVERIGKECFYRASDVLANRIEHATRAAEERMARIEREDLDATKERARETKARADNIELKNAMLRRELCPVEVVSAVLAKVSGQMSAALDVIPTAVKRKVPKLTATELEIIKREIVKCQNAAARSPVYLDEVLDDIARTESQS